MEKEQTSVNTDATLRRPKTLRVGLLLVLIGCYLFFLPIVIWPFVEPKLLLLNIGAVLVWWSGLRVTRRPGLSAGILALVLVLAAILGTGPLDSVLGVRFASTGLVLFLPCLFLIASLPSLPDDILERVPVWLRWLGLALVGLMLFDLLLPGLMNFWPELHFTLTGSVFAGSAGHRIFAIGLLSVSLAAALHLVSHRKLVAGLVAVGVIALGIAMPRQVSTYILPVVVLAAWYWKERPDRSLALKSAGVVLLAFVLSYGVTALPTFQGHPKSPALIASREPAAAPPGQTGLTSASAVPAEQPEAFQRRFTVWRVGLRAWEDRPILGWGTDNGFNGYLANVTTSEAASLAPEREWWDVHNIFIQILLTTGVIGLIALLFLLWQTLPSVLRAPPELGWATASVLSLGFFFLYEPFSVTVLPVLAIVLGIASRPRGGTRPATIGWPRPVIAVVLAGCTVLSALALAQSGFFSFALQHRSEPALRTAAALVPWRTEPQWWLQSINDPAAANAKMAELVKQDPWDPEIRLSASWVAETTGNRPLAEQYLKDQLQRFPGDQLGVDAVLGGFWPP